MALQNYMFTHFIGKNGRVGLINAADAPNAVVKLKKKTWVSTFNWPK